MSFPPCEGDTAISDQTAALEPGNPPAARKWERSTVLPGLVAWLIMAAALAWTFWPEPWLVEPPDPDSQLRLVRIRDLLAGQGWFDAMQYRLGGEGGLAMHWSRLVDAPMWALVAAGDALFGPGGGETLLMYAWPLGAFLGFVLVALATARRLGGYAAVLPAAVLTILNIDILTHFIPGRLDHHNILLVLLLVLVYGLLGGRSDRRAGILSGLALAAMLAIAMESLPYAVAAGAFLPLAWAFDGQRQPDPRLAGFGIALALALGVFYLLLVPTGGAVYCDAFSAVYLSIGMIGGLGVAALSFIAAGKGPVVRLAGLAGIGAAILAVTVLFFPDCLGGPYGSVSAELQEGWMDTVAEAQPLWSYAAIFPAQAFASFAAPLLALIIAAGRAFSRRSQPAAERQRWICVLAFLASAMLVSVIQYRGTPFLNALSIPVLAVWIADWRARAEAGLKGAMGAIAVLAIWLGGLQVTYFALGHGVAALAERFTPETTMSSGQLAQMKARENMRRADAGAGKAERECVDPATAKVLAALPRGRVLSPLFFGTTILTLSDHSVLSGPYHRAEVPILDTLRAGSGAPEEARAVIDRHKIDYVVVCPTSREALLMVQEQDSGLFVDLVLGRPVPGLEPVSAPGTYLQIYRVR